MTGMSDIEQLLAIEEIKLLKARRDRACDTKDWDLYRALHADDHVSHNDGFERWESADVMIANVKALLDKGRTTVHHSHTPDITFESPTKAKAAFDKLSDGKDKEFIKVDAKYYEPVVELIKFVDQLRKQKS